MSTSGADGRSQAACGLLLLALLGSADFASGLNPFARKDAFARLNDYLVGSTESGDFAANLQLAKDLAENRAEKSGPDGDELRSIARLLARLPDVRDAAQLCHADSLAAMRAIAEKMNSHLELPEGGGPSKMRLAGLIQHVVMRAGKTCFRALQHEWRDMKSDGRPPESFAPVACTRIQVDFGFSANLCQKYQNKKNIEKDDLFRQSVQYSLSKAAKLTWPDLGSKALVAQADDGGKLSSEKIEELIGSLLLEPCRQMGAVRELGQVIRPASDLLIALVIVDQEDYSELYGPLAREIKDWIERFVMCDWLLEADPRGMARSIKRKGLLR